MITSVQDFLEKLHVGDQFWYMLSYYMSDTIYGPVLIEEIHGGEEPYLIGKENGEKVRKDINMIVLGPVFLSRDEASGFIQEVNG